MPYISTRGSGAPISFPEAVLAGLAPDGGLFLPLRVPEVSAHLEAWSGLSFTALCGEVFGLFTDGRIASRPLADMIGRSYAAFDHPQVTPLVRVGPVHVLELFHGPTLAFKDVALQFLGRLFEHLLSEREARLTVLGATSGDTGSAAIQALRGKRGIEVFILHPKGRVSPMQERQMTTVPDANIHCIAVEGSFDDAQKIVKALFSDRAFNRELALGAINSINWARLMAQIVYFFYAYFRLLERPAGDLPAGAPLRMGDPVRFSVPTGNFGHILAGLLAKRMGLPIERLVLATNANDILHRFVRSGTYRRGDLAQTLSPSMDIQVASNFERYLYYLAGCDPERLRDWMAEIERDGELALAPEVFAPVADDLISHAVDERATLATIREVQTEYGYLLDPHSAVGFRAALAHGAAAGGPPTICMATAHPAKFGEAIRQATGAEPPLPPALAGLAGLPARVAVLPAREEAVRGYLRETLAGIPVPPVFPCRRHPRADDG